MKICWIYSKICLPSWYMSIPSLKSHCKTFPTNAVMAHVIHSLPRMFGEANLAQAQTKVQLGCVKYSADLAIGNELYIALLTSLTKAEKGNTQVNNRGKVFVFCASPTPFLFSLSHHT